MIFLTSYGPKVFATANGLHSVNLTTVRAALMQGIFSRVLGACSIHLRSDYCSRYRQSRVLSKLCSQLCQFFIFLSFTAITTYFLTIRRVPMAEGISTFFKSKSL